MIYSMTGYGAAKSSADGLEFSIELKSVNNRYLDVAVRLPRSYIFAEESIKALVQKHISRGKVDVFVTVENTGAGNTVIAVNEALAAGYIDALRTLCTRFGLADDITATAVARLPEVLTAEKREADQEAVLTGISTAVGEALCALDDMRAREGKKLADDISARLDAIEAMTGEVERRSPDTVADYRARLEQRLREVLDGRDIDDARVLTECAVFADRVAVDEETVRLRSHIAQFRDMLAGGSPAGRKLDFLIQEFNRETNTIGSKCSDREITRTVVDMKAEIEKIREQVQNIE